MRFRNPSATKYIEGRLPRADEGFSNDHYYCDSIENVFVRFDPYEDHIRVVFPCANELALKIKTEVLEELAKKEVTLIELIRDAYNVEDVITTPDYDYTPFDEDREIYIKFKKGL